MTGQLPPSLKGSDKLVMAVLGLIGLGIFGAVGIYVLPLLILAATNTLIFGAELLACVLIPLMLWDSRTALYYKWANFSRGLRRKVVADDPIGTLATVIARFESRLEDVSNLLTQATAAKKMQAKAIKDAFAKRDNYTHIADVARSTEERNMNLAFANRWDKQGTEMQPMLDLLERTEIGMQGARQMIIDKITDMKDQQEALTLRFTAMKASQKAVSKFKQFFGSNPDLEMLQMSMDEIEIQATRDESEIDNFLKDIQPMMAANDAQKRADALEAVEKFANRSLTASTQTPETKLIEAPKAVKELVKK